jgi:hypothetical protein
MKLIIRSGIYVILTALCLNGCTPSLIMIKDDDTFINIMLPPEKKISCEVLNTLWKELFLTETCFIKNVCVVTLSSYRPDNASLREGVGSLEVLLDMDETRFTSRNAYFFAQQLVGISYYLKGSSAEALLLFRKLNSLLTKTSIPDEERAKFYIYYALSALKSLSSDDFGRAMPQCGSLSLKKHLLQQIARLVDEIKNGEEKEVVSQVERMTVDTARKRILLLLVKKMAGKELSLSEVRELAEIAAKYNLSNIASLWEFCLGKEEAASLFAGIDVRCKE